MNNQDKLKRVKSELSKDVDRAIFTVPGVSIKDEYEERTGFLWTDRKQEDYAAPQKTVKALNKLIASGNFQVAKESKYRGYMERPVVYKSAKP